MSFFQGASNVKIVGGEFNDIKGNLTVFDRSRHEINVDTGNVLNNKLINSFNDNSTRISGGNPGRRRSRFPGDDDDDDPMQSSTSTLDDDREEEDHTGPPPPQHPPFMPRNLSSAGGNVTNKDSFNVKNTNVKDVFNDYSRNYYDGPAPPTKPRRRQNPSIYEEEEEDPQSNSRSTGNGAWFNGSPQVHFQGGFPQHMRNGMSSGPFISVDSPLIQHMDPKMRRDFEKLMNYTKLQTMPDAPGNSEGNDESDDDGQDSSSYNMEEKESITPRMAKLSVNDHMPSPVYLSSPPILSTNKSDPQIALQPAAHEANHPMGSPSSSHLSPSNNALHHSHSSPSMAPHMREPAMVQFLSQPTAAHPVDNNVPNNPSSESTSGFNFPPSSSGGPIFRTIHGNMTKYDDTVHQTNLNSFNTEHNTIKDSFNDNSVVQSSGKEKETKKKRFFGRGK